RTRPFMASPFKWVPDTSRGAWFDVRYCSETGLAWPVARSTKGVIDMKIVVIGGTGLIGSKLVKKLREMGQDVLAASPDSGVNTLTGDGLQQAVAGAQVVVDVSNSPSFEDEAAMKFFKTATGNLLAAEKAAG